LKIKDVKVSKTVKRALQVLFFSHLTGVAKPRLQDPAFTVTVSLETAWVLMLPTAILLM